MVKIITLIHTNAIQTMKHRSAPENIINIKKPIDWVYKLCGHVKQSPPILDLVHSRYKNVTVADCAINDFHN